MKRFFSYVNIQKLVIAVILICTSVLFNNAEVNAENEASTLIFALRNNGIKVSDKLDYSQIMQKLQSMRIDVPVSYKESVIKYLDAGKASHLIKIKTSKPDTLTWYFHSVIFLKDDLIFAQYDDGEMYGGDILLKITYSNNEAIGMKALWNYH